MVDSDQPSPSVAKPNIHEKTFNLCLAGAKRIIYHELLDPEQTVIAELYQTQQIKLSGALEEKRPRDK